MIGNVETLVNDRRPIRSARRQLKQAGMALVGTMLCLFLLMGMLLIGILCSGPTSGSGAMDNADEGLFTSQHVQDNIAAANLAEAGVEDTILWLSAQGAPPPNSSAFAPSSTAFTLPLWSATTQSGTPPRAVVDFPDANNTFSVTVYPCSANPGNAQKSFLIESIGSYYGFKQVLHAYVTQTSFGHYSFFENGAGGGYFFSSAITFDGPVHMNNVVGTTIPMSLEYADGTMPIFSYNGPDAYTVGFGLTYYHNWVQQSGPPASTNTAAWNELSPNGPSSIKDNQNNISLPSTTATSSQLTAALGTLSTAPTSTIGATACPSGGIYIHGSIQQMTLSVSPTNSATQIIQLYQINPSNGVKVYTNITLNATTNQTVVQTGTFTTSGTTSITSTTTTSGLTNGVIYCDGNIGNPNTLPEGGLNGVIADNSTNSNGVVTHSNALTIATSPTGQINEDGSLVYNTQRQIQQSAGGQYEFYNNAGQIVTSSSSVTPSGDVPYYVPESSDTGSFLTKAGSLGIVTGTNVQGCLAYTSTGLTGTGYLPYMELDAALFSYNTFKANSLSSNQYPTLVMGGDVHNGPEAACGFKKFSFDNRMSNTPPPYFPTTQNRYTVTSWQQVETTIDGSP